MYISVNDDYFISSEGEFEFDPSTNPVACFNGLTIEQDAILEENETFALFLSSSDPSVFPDPIFSQLTIQIIDSNSKFDMNIVL